MHYWLHICFMFSACFVAQQEQQIELNWHCCFRHQLVLYHLSLPFLNFILAASPPLVLLQWGNCTNIHCQLISHCIIFYHFKRVSVKRKINRIHIKVTRTFPRVLGKLMRPFHCYNGMHGCKRTGQLACSSCFEQYGHRWFLWFHVNISTYAGLPL